MSSAAVRVRPKPEEYIPVQRRYETGTVKDNLILAGIEELGRNGVQHFSLRRVAATCGVSCAAPYKHFRDKEAFLFAVVEYVHDLWAQRQEQVLRTCPDDPRQQLIASSMAYIHFLVEHPHVRSILMMKDSDFGGDPLPSKSRLTPRTRDLIRAYCDRYSIPREVEVCKTFTVRALVYGAALLIDNGEVENTPQSFAYAERMISRVFDEAEA